MDARWLVDLKGRTYCLYAGLLAEAHERGLKAIETTLIQVPCADNDHIAIAKAVVIMADGETFTEFGDASPRNVARHLIEATIRMALTRSKARALRDAINVGETCLEELDQEADAPANPGKARAHAGVTAAETETVSDRVRRPGGALGSGRSALGGTEERSPSPPSRPERRAQSPEPPASPGFEAWFETGGKRYQRVSLISTLLTDLSVAQEWGMVSEPLEPETATNTQLYIYGRTLRQRLKAAKDARHAAGAQASGAAS